MRWLIRDIGGRVIPVVQLQRVAHRAPLLHVPEPRAVVGTVELSGEHDGEGGAEGADSEQDAPADKRCHYSPASFANAHHMRNVMSA